MVISGSIVKAGTATVHAVKVGTVSTAPVLVKCNECTSGSRRDTELIVVVVLQ